MLSAVWLIFIGLVAVVAVSDVVSYRIPNWATLALLALFVGVLAWHRADVPWPWHLAAFVTALTIGILFFTFRQMGAGDAKLFAVLALWAGFAAIIPLLFFVAIAGMFELLVLTIARRMVAGSTRPLPRVLTAKQGVPLGAGLALGAAIASFWFPSWLWMA